MVELFQPKLLATVRVMTTSAFMCLPLGLNLSTLLRQLSTGQKAFNRRFPDLCHARVRAIPRVVLYIIIVRRLLHVGSDL